MTDKASIILHTDRELAAAELVGTLNSHFDFKNVIRNDLNRQGYDVRFSRQPLEFLLRYLATMHNALGRAPDSDLTPLEVISSRKSTRPTVTLLWATALSELPDAVLKDLGTHP